MSQRLNADAHHIRKLVREAEAVTDEVIAAYAKLKQKMIEARSNPGVQVGAGQDALIRLVGAEQKIVAAASDLLRVHDSLSAIARTTAGIDEDVPTERGQAVEAPAARLQAA